MAKATMDLCSPARRSNGRASSISRPILPRRSAENGRPALWPAARVGTEVRTYPARREPLAGFPAEVVTRIDRLLLNVAEYKRRQAAPGVKVTEKNFGRDRRYPITNRFRDNGKALPEPDEKLVARAGRASADVFDG